jgi:cyclopropane fatty-acyl-phospholipid synthase-like methyltransferase
MADTSSDRVQVEDGVEYRFSADWTKKLEEEFHWRLYWNQASVLDGLIRPGEHLLEIGPGTGFMKNYLISKGYRVTTLDIDDQKGPDIVANIVTYPFEERYDAILAFEVFEHLPFDRFAETLPRIAAACRKALVFSVPQHRKTPFYLEIKLPKLKPFRIKWTKRGKRLSAKHFWEVDYRQFTQKKLLKTIGDAGLRVERHRAAFHREFFACIPIDTKG